MKRFLALLLVFLLLVSAASAEKKKSNPEPRVITEEVIEEVPEQIQQLLDLAYSEMEACNGQNMKKRNKYTDWNGSHTGYGWCGGFITWCTLEVGIPQYAKNKAPKEPVPGVVHINEAGVGKLVDGYMRMNNRITMTPQKGFIVVYGHGNSKNKKVGGLTKNYHVGLVYDVEKLENGKYRLTTIEGNVTMDFTDEAGERHKTSYTIRMYVRDYDPHAEKLTQNLTLVPEEEQDRPESLTFSYEYTYGNTGMYISRFLMPWIPEENAEPGEIAE